jgi:hypothetical protein
MITLRRLDMVRQDSPATADELASLQTQLNTAFDQINVALAARPVGHVTTLPTTLPADPSGYLEIVISGTTYVVPVFQKA